jgi:hypothetical protein
MVAGLAGTAYELAHITNDGDNHFALGGAMGSALVLGLSDPLGLPGAVAAVAVIPAAGAALALAAGRAPFSAPAASA